LKLSDCLKYVGKPFFYYPKIAKAAGSVKAAILICALAWRDLDFEDGEILKTEKQLIDETGLSSKELRLAKQRLSQLKILTIHYRRLEHITSFILNLDALDALMESENSTRQKGRSPKPLPEAPAKRADGQISKGQVAPAERADGEVLKGQIDLLLENKSKKIEKQEDTIAFDQFWKLYPRKVAKPKARQAWNKAQINGALPEILQWISGALKSGAWNEEQYIPHPTTFLNQRRWEDPIPKTRKSQSDEDYILNKESAF
jgi:hypothetical protein